jgi:hypothetical protein
MPSRASLLSFGAWRVSQYRSPHEPPIDRQAERVPAAASGRDAFLISSSPVHGIAAGCGEDIGGGCVPLLAAGGATVSLSLSTPQPPGG